MPLSCAALRTYDWCDFVEKMVRSEAGNLAKEAFVATNTVPMAVEYLGWIVKLRDNGFYDEIERTVPIHGVLTHGKFLAVRKLTLKKTRAQLKEPKLGGC